MEALEQAYNRVPNAGDFLVFNRFVAKPLRREKLHPMFLRGFSFSTMPGGREKMRSARKEVLSV